MSDVQYGRGFVWNVVFAFFSKATFAIVSIAIANKLGPAPIGIFALLATIYNFAETMREAGLKQAFYNDSTTDPSRYRTYCRLSLTSGLAFGLIMLGLAYPAALFYKLPDLSWCMALAALAVSVNSFSSIPSAAMLKAGRFRDTGLIESVATLSAGVVAIALVWFGFGLFGLMMQLVTRSLVLFVLFQRLQPVAVRDCDRAAIRPIMRLCVQLVTTDLLWMFYSIGDMLLVPKTLGEVANGSYGMGRRLVAVPAELVFAPLHRTIIVAVGHRAGDDRELGRALGRTLGLAVLLLIPIYIAVAVYSGPFVHALLRRDLWPTATVIPILCVSEAARGLGTFGATALVAAGRPKLPMLAWLIPYPIAGTLLALNWHHLSLTMVAWSFAAGMVGVNTLVLAGAFASLHSWKMERLKLAKALGCTAVTATVAVGLAQMPVGNWTILGAAIVVVPLFHLAVVGMVFARRPLAYMSPAGFRNLRTTL